MVSGFYTNAQQSQVLRVIPDLIESRALLRDLVWKELRARYRNAMMGLLWAVLQPVLMMLILTFVFGYLLVARGLVVGGSGGHPYAVKLLCGLVPWLFLSAAVTSAAHSLVASQDLIKKVYFAREVIPLAAILNCVVNVVIGFLTLLVVMAILEGASAIGSGVLWVPLVFAIQFMLVIGLGLLCSALNVYYRDVGYLIDVALAFGFYATPILYDMPKNLSMFPAEWATWLYRLYLLNPMAHLVEAYRQALLENRFPDAGYLLWPLVLSAGILVLGVVVFRRSAPTFADYL
jgi:ABC-type polysaccharide/polyol phosphate export permease